MMGKHHTAKEEDWGFGSAPAAPAPADKKAKKKEATAPAAETVAAEEPDTPALKELTHKNIADTFSALAAAARAEKQAFAPTLTALNALVTMCQEAGLRQIGLEQANFNTLRELRLIKEGSSEQPPLAHYAILSIDDARILVRVLPDSVIDCYGENINKPRSNPTYLDSKTFWNPSGKSGESMFHRYDLSKDEDRLEFVETVIITAAATGALQELRQYDVPARETIPLPKPRHPKLK
ncbi:MAG TPA: hypothetical protein PLX33_04980 [Alphaproteobacteria bacterium]|nr:hypothetical protein [Alphaproteobacteria bacterium]